MNTLTIEKHEELKWQDSSFYCNGGLNTLVTLTNELGKTMYVTANGEMYLSIPEVQVNEDGTTELADVHTRIRYSDDLIELGIDTDYKLNWLTKIVCEISGFEMWHMNNWFEVFGEDEDGIADDMGEVLDSLDEALEYAKAELNNGNNN